MMDRLENFRSPYVPVRPPSLELLSVWLASHPFPGWHYWDTHSFHYCGDTLHTRGGLWVYDTETWVKGLSVPVLASAIHQDSGRLYLWLSPLVYSDTCSPDPLEFARYLVPVEGAGLMLAHNANYDAIRTRGTYLHGGLDWFDTLSAFVAVRGGSNQQMYSRGSNEWWTPDWEQETAEDYGLASVSQFYLGAEGVSKADKQVRDFFVNLEHPRQILEAPEAVLYALQDVIVLDRVCSQLIPEWLDALPSEMSRESHVLLMRSRLPLAPDWFEWLRGVQTAHADFVAEELATLEALKTEAIAQGPDAWTGHLDWTPLKSGPRKGLPKWATGSVGLKAVAGPSLLRLSWDGIPLTYHPTLKWGVVRGGEFERLPHPDGTGDNVGSPVGKKFVPLLGTRLTSENPRAKELLTARRRWAYWESVQSRVTEVRPVRVDVEALWG